MRRDLKLSGFVANEIKSQWTPAQRGELLVFVLDLSTGTFQVPKRRVYSFCVLLETVVSKGLVASARQLSRFTGLLAFMGLALGPVVRLWTRSLYRDILRSASWDSPFRMSDDAVCEVLFWQDNFNNSGYPIWSPSPKPEVLSFSDASESGWGGFTAQVGGKVAVGSWSLEEMGRSSTLRELRATRRVLEALAPHLKGSEVLHRTDNKNTEIILSIGSRQADLHDEAVSVYKLCRAYDIRLTVEWVSLDYNVVADELSRIEDENDYMLDRSCFMSLDRLWGPHLVDHFASEKTKQLDRFCSRFLNPGCEAANAFTLSWTGVNNWLFPPPFLVPRVLRHMSVGKEDGTLLVPEWRSAPWWPLLVTRRGRWREFVVDSRQIQPYEGIFVPGSAASSIFSSGTPAFSLLALKLKFSSTSAPITPHQLRRMLVTKMLVPFWLATGRFASFRSDNGTFCAVLISCLPVMGRPLWLCLAPLWFCVHSNSAAPVMVSSETWIDIWLLWLPLPVMGFPSYGVPVMGKCQIFVLGYPPSPSFFVIRVWALCGSSCPALVMPFPGWVLPCCSFTKLCHLLQLPILLRRSSPFHLSLQPICSKTQS